MHMRWMPDVVRYRGMNTAELRSHFLIEELVRGEACGAALFGYGTDDCGVRGAGGRAGSLNGGECGRPISGAAAGGFCQRGRRGTVGGNSVRWSVADCLYVGRGRRKWRLPRRMPRSRRCFIWFRIPHTRRIRRCWRRRRMRRRCPWGSPGVVEQADDLQVHSHGGDQELPAGDGVHGLEAGRVEHDAAAHAHAAVRGVFVFQRAAAARVFHLMGSPQETRHLVVADRQVVISPSWSIHAGIGHAAITRFAGRWAGRTRRLMIWTGWRWRRRGRKATRQRGKKAMWQCGNEGF